MGKKNGNGGAVAKIETPGGALAELMGADEFKEMLQEQVSCFEKPTFPLIKIPTGGAINFELPDGSAVKEIEAVIIYHRPARGYWEKSLDDGGGATMPDCSSTDGKHGVALSEGFVCPSPTGLCRDCPMNQFGSKLNKDGSPGRGKACTTKHFLYFVDAEANEIIPTLFRVPVTSIKELQEYFISLAKNSLRHIQVVSVLSLVKDKNADGTPFSRLEIERRKELPSDDVVVRAFNIRQSYKSAMVAQLMTKEVVSEDAEEDTF